MAAPLSKSVVVVNEFTVRKESGGGTRGGTPGQYVIRYMARDQATEPVAPITRGELDTFVTKYMARSQAVERVVTEHRDGLAVVDGVRPSGGYTAPTLAGRRRQRSAARSAARRARRNRARLGEPAAQLEITRRSDLSRDLARTTGDGGVAFGHSGLSLSHERLHHDARQIQQLFDAGHTVLKTVISFDHDYLQANGLIPAGMDTNAAGSGSARRGDYRGKLDQFKLRMAVSDGLAHMSRVTGFDDLRYVGVIQVDTSQVHCHLAMVDAGPGRLAANGEQKGKLSQREMAVLRRGLDSSLDRHSRVAHLSSAVGYQRRNVSAYVKNWAYSTLGVSAKAQFILACLPPQRRLWRAATNAQEMDKPNRLVRALVEEHLAQPGSPMPEAMAKVREYAYGRQRREGIDDELRDKLIADGRERIISQAMNGVYTVLASVADDELVVTTPMLSVMSSDFDDLISHVSAGAAQRQDPGESEQLNAGQFALRLRAYTERYRRHSALRGEYLARAGAWEQARDAGLAAPGSQVMYEHYLLEAEYHGRCLSKYQYYLDLTTASTSDWGRQWQQVEEYGRKLTGLRALRADQSIPKMAVPQAAEELGRQLYGQPGGARLAATGAEGRAGRAIIDGRIKMMAARYKTMADELVQAWRTSGPGVRIRLAPAGTEPEQGEQVISAGVAPEQAPGALPAAGQVEQPEPAEPELADPGVAVLVTAAPQHEFDEVKGLDMHELGLDWTTDQQVGPRCARTFAEMASRRGRALDAAEVWMVSTGQGEQVDAELGPARADVERSQITAVEVLTTGKLRSLLAVAARRSAARAAARSTEVEQQDQDEMLLTGQEQAREAEHAALARDQLEAWLLADARGRAAKPRGVTASIDSGLGGAVNASIDEVVRGSTAVGEQR